jgi:hypothetical protein
VNDVLDTDTAYIKCSVRLLCKLGLLASWSLARVAEKSARTKAIDELTVADATLQLIVDELAEAGWWDVVEEISGRLSNEASEHVGRLNFFVMKNLAIKRLQGNDVIRGWLQSWDVTALDEEWKFNKAVLLDDMESAFKLLPEVISRKAVTPTKLWASPLYEELRSDNRFIDIGPPKPKPVVQLPEPPNLWR